MEQLDSKASSKLLRRYRELRSIVNVRGIEGIPIFELKMYQRGERLEAYLTQPFYTTEKYTGKKGDQLI